MSLLVVKTCIDVNFSKLGVDYGRRRGRILAQFI